MPQLHSNKDGVITVSDLTTENQRTTYLQTSEVEYEEDMFNSFRTNLPGYYTCTSVDAESHTTITSVDNDEKPATEDDKPYCVAALVTSVLSVEPEESYAFVIRLCLLKWADKVHVVTVSQVDKIIETLATSEGKPVPENVREKFIIFEHCFTSFAEKRFTLVDLCYVER